MAESERPRLAAIHRQLNRAEKARYAAGATPSAAGVRRRPEAHLETGYRQSFSVDVDRILHSLAYTRYVDKTQVFYLIDNDHITHRVLHVQLVSKIGRTIGRFLGLNEDLIEAVALGHDIGHVPFGHDGESLLSELCREHGIGWFHHNVQSVEFLERVEKKGRGLNLCLQTLDGILCHDGEVHDRWLKPRCGKTFEELDRQVTAAAGRPRLNFTPMTLEGCVMRLADTVSYIGRDLEDAIRLGLVARDDIPPACARVLGRSNGTIVYNLVTDIIENSYGRDAVGFSEEVSAALQSLKKFNYERIYLSPMIKRHYAAIGALFRKLFNTYLEDIEKERRDSVIFTRFLKNMSPGYTRRRRPAEIVRDFIAGMTDRYFLRQCGPEGEALLRRG